MRSKTLIKPTIDTYEIDKSGKRSTFKARGNIGTNTNYQGVKSFRVPSP